MTLLCWAPAPFGPSVSYKMSIHLRYDTHTPTLAWVVPGLASKLLVKTNLISKWQILVPRTIFLFVPKMAVLSFYCCIALINGPLSVLHLLYPVLWPCMPYQLAGAINGLFFLKSCFMLSWLPAISQGSLFLFSEVCPEVPKLADFALSTREVCSSTKTW